MQLASSFQGFLGETFRYLGKFAFLAKFCPTLAKRAKLACACPSENFGQNLLTWSRCQNGQAVPGPPWKLLTTRNHLHRNCSSRARTQYICNALVCTGSIINNYRFTAAYYNTHGLQIRKECAVELYRFYSWLCP